MPEHTSTELSAGVGEYLEAIYKLAADASPVQVPALAERMRVAAASANEMVRRLSERGLVNYEPYRGVTLTDEGRRQALAVVRRHRLWERFLFDYLTIPWDLVHDEACRLEHATSPLLEERLAAFLDSPTSCPHGYPVPSSDGRLLETTVVSISDLQPGDESIVVHVPEDDGALLRYLDELDLRPGRSLTLIAAEPFDGPITIRVGGSQHAIGSSLASRIGVRPLGDER